MSIFEKGNFKRPKKDFKRTGMLALRKLSEFQDTFGIQDTDTTINSIRDTIIADYLGFDLVNEEKHGFDARKSRTGELLEIKQCSMSAKRWGGTWNDTNLEKAKAFSGKRLLTAIAVWKNASDLQFIVFGKSKKLGDYLKKRIQSRKKGSRSTQTIGITKLIEWGFSIYVPHGRKKKDLIEKLVKYNKKLAKLITTDDIKDFK